jgi:solute carrier family 30 (zinc transporter), member 5/7
MIRSTSETSSSTSATSFMSNIPSLIIPLILISIFLFVFDFYVEQMSIVKLDRIRTFQYGTLTMVVGALLLSFFWVRTVTIGHDSSMWFTGDQRSTNSEEHELSGGVVFAVVMFAFATDLLSSPIKQRSGAFIGYGQDGLPVFNLTHQKSQSLLLMLRSSLKDVLAESDSRQIFYFLCINLVSSCTYSTTLLFIC